MNFAKAVTRGGVENVRCLHDDSFTDDFFRHQLRQEVFCAFQWEQG
jgi:hypothetical protein